MLKTVREEGRRGGRRTEGLKPEKREKGARLCGVSGVSGSEERGGEGEGEGQGEAMTGARRRVRARQGRTRRSTGAEREAECAWDEQVGKKVRWGNTWSRWRRL